MANQKLKIRNSSLDFPDGIYLAKPPERRKPQAPNYNSERENPRFESWDESELRKDI